MHKLFVHLVLASNATLIEMLKAVNRIVKIYPEAVQFESVKAVRREVMLRVLGI